MKKITFKLALFLVFALLAYKSEAQAGWFNYIGFTFGGQSSGWINTSTTQFKLENGNWTSGVYFSRNSPATTVTGHWDFNHHMISRGGIYFKTGSHDWYLGRGYANGAFNNEFRFHQNGVDALVLQTDGRLKLNSKHNGVWYEAGTHDWFVGRGATGGTENDDFRFFHNGDKMVLIAQGNLGIGTSAPSHKIDLGTGLGKKIALYQTAAADDFYGLGISGGTLDIWAGNQTIINVRSAHVNFTKPVQGTSASFSGNIQSSGNVQANTLTLNIGSFPDYVFAKNYDLMPLEEVEAYIKANHHLPKVPKAAKIEKDGMNVGQINVLLMEKVEELTLHTIAQNKQLKTQNKQIKALMKRLEKLEKKQALGKF